jgi:glycosyltransferase involved in cell wall biosynthesis
MNDLTEPATWFPAVRAGTGTDTFTESLVDGLQRRGLRAEISWLPHRAEYLPWTVPIPKPPAWANIVHVNTWLHSRFIPCELPVVATMHHCVHDSVFSLYKSTGQSIYHRYWVRRLERRVLHTAQKVVAVSHYTAERTGEAFDTRDIIVIHNGIDLNTFQPLQRDRPSRPFRLLFVGKRSVRKGVDLLDPIMRRLGSDHELVYTASQNPNKRTENMPNGSRSLGTVPNIHGMVNIYQNADALLFPTRLEGFGLAALEAQACGLPVIATECSSLPEVVEQGVTGILCPQDDVAAFADAAQRLSADPDLWHRMAKAARARAEARFNIETMVDRYLAVYRSLLSRGQKGSSL